MRKWIRMTVSRKFLALALAPAMWGWSARRAHVFLLWLSVRHVPRVLVDVLIAKEASWCGQEYAG